MSMSSEMLKGYLLKCGVDIDDASLIADRFGEYYLTDQAKHRSMGGGKSAKARAAIDAIRFGTVDFSWPEGSSAKESREGCLQYMASLRSLSIAFVAIHAYALQTKIADEALEILGLDKIKLLALCALFELQDEAKQFFVALREDLKTIQIKASTLGENKGFFSKILG